MAELEKCNTPRYPPPPPLSIDKPDLSTLRITSRTHYVLHILLHISLLRYHLFPMASHSTPTLFRYATDRNEFSPGDPFKPHAHLALPKLSKHKIL